MCVFDTPEPPKVEKREEIKQPGSRGGSLEDRRKKRMALLARRTPSRQGMLGQAQGPGVSSAQGSTGVLGG